MKFRIWLLLVGCGSGFLMAQNGLPIESIEAKGTIDFLIAAYKGDTIVLQMEKHKGGKLGKLVLKSLDGVPIFEQENVKKLHQKIVAPISAVYQVVLKNYKKKTCSYKFKKEVVPSSSKVARIIYKVQRDTVYGYSTQQYRTIEQIDTRPLQQEKYFLNSRSSALFKGGKNRIIIPVSIPKNVKEWYYSFTASREEKDIANTLSTFNLASELSGFIKEKNSLQSAIRQVNAPPGANICDIYLFNKENASFFKEKENYNYIAEGSRENFKSGVVSVREALEDQYYIGINNPNNLYGIHVGINIVAVISGEQEILETINIPIITSYQIPVIK